ncbi:hypothetical protein SCE1572_12945 [Sorangium cellulosum So0157-2]|uniref:Uncharacterized protein n=1 Tax=Sorangium cellulosum So0157-2 TaxID=1254432 RepID=S4XXK4_SORCE|nr:hypothetical protein SCE1572_12945 [Sorangium cellulosum So0157-2]
MRVVTCRGVVTCLDPHDGRKLDGPDDDSAVPAHTVDFDVEGRERPWPAGLPW